MLCRCTERSNFALECDALETCRCMCHQWRAERLGRRRRGCVGWRPCLRRPRLSWLAVALAPSGSRLQGGEACAALGVRAGAHAARVATHQVHPARACARAIADTSLCIPVCRAVHDARTAASTVAGVLSAGSPRPHPGRMPAGAPGAAPRRPAAAARRARRATARASPRLPRSIAPPFQSRWEPTVALARAAGCVQAWATMCAGMSDHSTMQHRLPHAVRPLERPQA